jgi:uncharacterized surface protein with fasciclin (FAS1) repeats
MTVRTSFCQATALALPLGLAATGGHAADLLETAKGMDELSTFTEAVAAAGLDQQLEGEGPFTVFAPSNQAFEQLPALKDLLKQEHQAELSKLLSHHVVEGKAVSAEDVAGREMSVDTATGGKLTVDGTDSVILVVLALPSEGAATAGDGREERTEVAEGSDMPVTEHQEELLASDVSEETRQTAPAGGMPASEHQKEVLASDEETQQTAPAGGMPASEHQKEVLASDVGQETRQTVPAGEMPATEHQKEVLAEGESPAAGGDSGGQAMEHASVVEPGVEADNGVIYVIDAVLVPQDTRETLERLKGGA